MSNSLWPHGLQHTRFPCPSPSPRVCSNSCPFKSMLPSNHLILCCPLLCMPLIFSSIRVFSNESALHIRWPKYWSFHFNTNPSNEYSGLVSFRIDYILTYLLSKGLSRVFSSTTVLKHQFFSAQPSLWSNSHLHTRLLKIAIALTIQTFVGKVMSLFFNMLSRFAIAFLPRSKHLLISWLQSPSTVILEPKKVKSLTVSTFFPFYMPWSDGTGCYDLSFLNVEF